MFPTKDNDRGLFTWVKRYVFLTLSNIYDGTPLLKELTATILSGLKFIFLQSNHSLILEVIVSQEVLDIGLIFDSSLILPNKTRFIKLLNFSFRKELTR